MSKLYNLARMSTTTTGTGTITLASAVSGYLTFALAGVSNGDVVSYGIKDGSNSEVGTGTYTSSGTTLTRTVTKSTNSNAAISLSGAAEVFITARAEDLLSVSETQTANRVYAGPSTGSPAAPTFRALVAADLPSTGPSAAVQADQEAASSTTVYTSPGVQQYHPSAAKAWVAWGVTSTIDVSYNVSSITDNGTGDWTVNFSTSFSSANYAAVLTIRDTSDISNSNFIGVKQGTAPTASACRVFCKTPAPTAVDPTKNYAAFFGDQ
jgi:hypothetical protein